MITDMDRPNGICFSPDGSLLYVVDSGQIRVFDMVDGRPASTAAGSSTWRRAAPTGSAPTRDGNVWSAAAGGGAGFDGVHCYAPDGTLLGQIVLPEACANLTASAGRKRNRLFMAASQSLYSVYVNARGAQQP